MQRVSGLEELQVVVVRPYFARIRERVFAQLDTAGLEMSGATVIPTGTPDAAAVSQTIAAEPGMVLAPFNAHTDSGGEQVTGLEFLRQLVEAEPAMARMPVVMPLSSSAMAQIRLVCTIGERAREYSELLDRQVLLMNENDQVSSEFVDRIVEHVQKVRGDGSHVTDSSGVFAIDPSMKGS